MLKKEQKLSLILHDCFLNDTDSYRCHELYLYFRLS